MRYHRRIVKNCERAMRIGTSLTSLALCAAISGCIVQPVGYPPENSPPPGEDYAATDQVSEPPPPLPVYEQPPCPVSGYIWTPGVWQWGPAGYFWVPGTWVAPPAAGLLWTPGFWALAGAVYVFHAGYWGPHVGYYGGINYGFGYGGVGYAGGRWANNTFEYNRAVTNVNVNVIHNTYNQTTINNVTINNVTINNSVTRPSYAGAPGTRMQPNSAELAAAREAHVPPTSDQVRHQAIARENPELAAARNEGHPPIAATDHAGAYSGPGVVAAKPIGPAYRPQVAPVARSSQASPFVHARDVPARQVAAPERSESSADEAQEYARQQSELLGRHEQERQALAQQQQAEHENFARQPAHDQRAYEALERQHAQQTSQMQQRHQQEIQKFERSAPPHEQERKR
jgi:hypothetical protein